MIADTVGTDDPATHHTWPCARPVVPFREFKTRAYVIKLAGTYQNLTGAFQITFRHFHAVADAGPADFPQTLAQVVHTGDCLVRNLHSSKGELPSGLHMVLHSGWVSRPAPISCVWFMDERCVHKC